MKILFVCHRFPFPPERGGKIRPFNIIRHLSQSASVTVASLVRSDEELEQGRGIQDYCDRYIAESIGSIGTRLRMIMQIVTSQPSSMGYFYSSALKRRIDAELETGSYDLIFVHCSSAAQYVESWPDIPKILDFGDMDSEKWMLYAKNRKLPLSLGYWLEAVKLRRVEGRMAAAFDLCSCTTRAELETLQGLGTAKETAWFPNGVDTEFFSPTAEPYDPDLICFTGRFDYFPNQRAVIYFCHDVLPQIQTKRPNTRFVIIGAEPPAFIRKLGRLAGVTVTGTVPDVRMYVRRAAVSVAPLDIARGTQNKILEAMAMGIPVVASQQASKGVDAISGQHILVAHNTQDYVDTIEQLLQDPDHRKNFAEQARGRMLSHHSWAESMKRVDVLVDKVSAA